MLNRLYSWYGKRVVWGVIGAVVLLLCVGLIVHSLARSPETAGVAETIPSVTVSRVDALGTAGTLDLVGAVEAVDEVHLESEASGRVTAVPVALGASVGAGAVIARIENANEYAALLQAEGVYDAAVAAAASSDVGVSDARANAVSAYRSAYTTVNDVILNTVDQLYGDPNAPQTPGLRVSAYGDTNFLNTERVAYQTLLPDWQREAASLSASDDLDAALAEARQRTERTLNIVEIFLRVLPREDANGAFSASERAAIQDEFVSAQKSLNATLAAIDGAKDALARAELSGTGGAVSSADASVKQALGALRSAQANYQKTIITTPIGGTVNALSVKTGDYLAIGSPVALIANNGALIITTYVNAKERERIAIGDTVILDDTTDGTVSNIAPAIDPSTGKIEVKIAVGADEDLKNGDTVSLHFVASSTPAAVGGDLRVPLAAFKITPDGPVAFTVEDDGTLAAHAVVLGAIESDSVVVKEGLAPDMEIVTDARGLKEGERVTVTNR
jgi:RND family efflux transporter MFP subunit